MELTPSEGKQGKFSKGEPPSFQVLLFYYIASWVKANITYSKQNINLQSFLFHRTPCSPHTSYFLPQTILHSLVHSSNLIKLSILKNTPSINVIRYIYLNKPVCANIFKQTQGNLYLGHMNRLFKSCSLCGALRLLFRGILLKRLSFNKCPFCLKLGIFFLLFFFEKIFILFNTHIFFCCSHLH